MKTDTPLYVELDKAWKTTCRVLFGGEIGDLKEYEPWLREYLPKKTTQFDSSGLGADGDVPAIRVNVEAARFRAT